VQKLKTHASNMRKNAGNISTQASFPEMNFSPNAMLIKKARIGVFSSPVNQTEPAHTSIIPGHIDNKKKESMLLVLTRKITERLVINGNVWLKILAIKGRQVLIGIDAPDDVPVNREEVHERIKLEGKTKVMNEWRKKMQLYDMLKNRYTFTMDGMDLHFISEDQNHEGMITLSSHDRLSMFINVSRLLDVISKGDLNAK